MINYYKYLPTSSEDERWGMHVLNTGCNQINKNVAYPAPEHPAHHYFNWNKGRIIAPTTLSISNAFENKHCL